MSAAWRPHHLSLLSSTGPELSSLICLVYVMSLRRIVGRERWTVTTQLEIKQSHAASSCVPSLTHAHVGSCYLSAFSFVLLWVCVLSPILPFNHYKDSRHTHHLSKPGKKKVSAANNLVATITVTAGGWGGLSHTPSSPFAGKHISMRSIKRSFLAATSDFNTLKCFTSVLKGSSVSFSDTHWCNIRSDGYGTEAKDRNQGVLVPRGILLRHTYTCSLSSLDCRGNYQGQVSRSTHCFYIVMSRFPIWGIFFIYCDTLKKSIWFSGNLQRAFNVPLHSAWVQSARQTNFSFRGFIPLLVSACGLSTHYYSPQGAYEKGSATLLQMDCGCSLLLAALR